jgi:hypothetical protein
MYIDRTGGKICDIPSPSHKSLIRVEKRMDALVPPLKASGGLYSSLHDPKVTNDFFSYISKQSDLQFKVDAFSSFHSIWTSSDLGISQTCGSNLTQEYESYLTILGAPLYTAEGCEGKFYRSALVVSKLRFPEVKTLEDLAAAVSQRKTDEGLTIAVNSCSSCSGWFLLLSALAKYNQSHALTEAFRIRSVLQTGSHVSSVLTIGNNNRHHNPATDAKMIADLASIDCISLVLIRKHYPHLLRHVQIIGFTETAIAPPFVCSSSLLPHLKSQIQDLLQSIVNNSSSSSQEFAAVKEEMLLSGIDSNVTVNDYHHYMNYHMTLAATSFPHLIYQRSSSSSSSSSSSNKIFRPGKLLRDHVTCIIDNSTDVDTIAVTTAAAADTITVTAAADTVTAAADTIAVTTAADTIAVTSAAAAAEMGTETDTTTASSSNNNNNNNNTVEIIVKARVEDVMWYDTDVQFLYNANDFLLSYLSQILLSTLTTNTTTLTVEMIVETLQRQVVAQELYPLWCLGGHCKVIFPSVRGVLSYLYAMSSSLSTVTAAMSMTGEEIISLEQIELIQRLIQTAYNNVAVSLSEEEKNPADIWFAGFMGATHANMTEYFDEDQETEAKSQTEETRTAEYTKNTNNNTSSTASATTTTAAPKNLNVQVWAVDFALSEVLIAKGESLGVWAYISAPRHNDRYDWGNLVLGDSEAALTKWRGVTEHVAAGRELAPHCYEHIRLHRGIFSSVCSPATVSDSSSSCSDNNNNNNSAKMARPIMQIIQSTFLISHSSSPETADLSSHPDDHSSLTSHVAHTNSDTPTSSSGNYWQSVILRLLRSQQHRMNIDMRDFEVTESIPSLNPVTANTATNANESVSATVSVTENKISTRHRSQRKFNRQVVLWKDEFVNQLDDTVMIAIPPLCPRSVKAVYEELKLRQLVG